jgi:hypothetical protein
MQIRDVLGTIFFEVDEWMLLDYLEDSDFLCLIVDGRMKLHQDFVEEADWKGLKSNRRARALRGGAQLSS